jgi:hypothetical protein
MRKISAISFVAMLSTLGPHLQAKNVAQPRVEPYLFCNVYLSDVCFGIAAGDWLTLSHRGDFLLYNIHLTSGREGTVYYGFNPSLARNSEAEEAFRSCAGEGGFAECKRRAMIGGGIEFLARRDSQSMWTHITISGGRAGTEGVEAFLRNVRACEKKARSITCEP